MKSAPRNLCDRELSGCLVKIGGTGTRGIWRPCVVDVVGAKGSWAMHDDLLSSGTPVPSGTRPAFRSLVIEPSTTFLFACYVLSDQSGASVAGKGTLDLCATSGANLRGIALTSEEGSGHWSDVGWREIKVKVRN